MQKPSSAGKFFFAAAMFVIALGTGVTAIGQDDGFFPAASTAHAGAVKDLSAERQDFINGLVAEYVRSGENVDDPDVKALIYNDIKKIMPLKPYGNARVSSYRDMSEKVEVIM